MLGFILFAGWGKKRNVVVIVKPDNVDEKDNSSNHNDDDDDDDDGESSGDSKQVRGSQRSEIAHVETKGLCAKLQTDIKNSVLDQLQRLWRAKCEGKRLREAKATRVN